MPVIPLELAMKHTKADDEDEDLVTAYLEAAEDSAAQYLGRRFFVDATALGVAVIEETAGESPILINPSITAACLLLLGHLYANREEVVVGMSLARMPVGSVHLLMPYRVGLGV